MAGGRRNDWKGNERVIRPRCEQTGRRTGRRRTREGGRAERLHTSGLYCLYPSHRKSQNPSKNGQWPVLARMWGVGTRGRCWWEWEMAAQRPWQTVGCPTYGNHRYCRGQQLHFRAHSPKNDAGTQRGTGAPGFPTAQSSSGVHQRGVGKQHAGRTSAGTFLSLKREDILAHAAARMRLEDIMPNDVHKDVLCDFTPLRYPL